MAKTVKGNIIKLIIKRSRNRNKNREKRTRNRMRRVENPTSVLLGSWMNIIELNRMKTF